MTLAPLDQTHPAVGSLTVAIMLRRTVLLSLPTLAACTPVHPPSSRSEPTPTPTEDLTPTDTADPAAPTAELWKWDRGAEGWGGRANQTEVITDQGRYALRPFDNPTVPDAFGVVHVGPDGAVQWQAMLSQHSSPAGALILSGDQLYATHHSALSSGAWVSRLDRTTGEVRWTRQLEGLGPVAHDKYRNETQLEMDERGLTIYGKEMSGEYTEVLDPQTGETRSLTRPDPRFARLEWTGKAADAPFEFPTGPSQLAVDDTHYVLTEAEQLDHPAILERFDGHESAWATSLRSEGSCGTAAMMLEGTTLWVAHYCAIASGARLLAIDTQSGRILHDRHVIGLGPIGHSEYFCEVQLERLHGHVVVRGREAAGRYIEVVDPVTGQARVNLTFRD